jgi:hypothetical protein
VEEIASSMWNSLKGWTDFAEEVVVSLQPQQRRVGGVFHPALTR